KYNEFETLRQAGVRYADLRGYSYHRTDVTARGLTNAYAQTLAGVFTTESKPFEVELVVAELGITAERDQLYRLSYDGSVIDETEHVAIGGQADAITASLAGLRTSELGLAAVFGHGVAALAAATQTTLPTEDLEAPSSIGRRAGRGPSVDSMRQRCARCGRTEWYASSESRPNTGAPAPPPTADGASGPRRAPATWSDPSSRAGGGRPWSRPSGPRSTSMSDPTPNTRPPNAATCPICSPRTGPARR